MHSTFSLDGISRASETYSCAVFVWSCILSLICIQQLASPMDSAAKCKNMAAIDESSIQMSDLSGSAQTTIPSGAFLRNADPCGFALDSFSSSVCSVTKINSQGLRPIDEGERSAASIRVSIFSASTCFF